MIDLSIYFQPISVSIPFTERQLGAQIVSYQSDFPDLTGPGCAIFSVPEYRGAAKDQISMPALYLHSINYIQNQIGPNQFMISVQ